MSSPVGLLDFFVVEASEYIERLDALLAAAGPSGPDADAFSSAARALRGSATMSRQHGIAEVAGALERVGRALRMRALAWDPEIDAAVVAAIDDLRLLVRNVRRWGPDDERRTRTRAAELQQLVPPSARTTPAVAPAALAGSSYLAGEVTDLARALDRAVAAFDDLAARTTLANQVHVLRGLADLADAPPLPEVIDALDQALRTLGTATDPPGGGSKHRALFSAAAALLHRAGTDIAERGRPAAGMPALIPFNAAVVALHEDAGRGDRIVPIDQLSFDGERDAYVVERAEHPPTTAAERFRLEVVSLAEHLRATIGQARAARDAAERDRATRALRGALRALGSTANSFGERHVARFAAAWTVRVATLDPPAIDALDDAAELLAGPDRPLAETVRELDRLSAARYTPAVSVMALGTAAQPQPQPTGAPSHRGRPTPTGRELHALLADGIAGIAQLDDQPLSPPLPIPDEVIVPIDELLYRGRAALERAAELGAELRQRTGAAPPPADAIAELLDLVDLALAG